MRRHDSHSSESEVFLDLFTCELLFLWLLWMLQWSPCAPSWPISRLWLMVSLCNANCDPYVLGAFLERIARRCNIYVSSKANKNVSVMYLRAPVKCASGLFSGNRLTHRLVSMILNYKRVCLTVLLRRQIDMFESQTLEFIFKFSNTIIQSWWRRVGVSLLFSKIT